jgi:hypothetical protein
MAKRKSTSETLIAYVYGINSRNEVISISVHRKGSSIKLNGPNGSHLVHPSNERGRWAHEAALVWGLTDVIEIPPDMLNSETHKEQVAELREKAGKKKKEREKHGDQT